jgi:hypothetical protein
MVEFKVRSAVLVQLNNPIANNGTACFKWKQLFEYQHLLLLEDIWWSKF